ncbi:transient receptor potential channel pyrexia [Calliopsis andreniformis]|uniref:transient receptor potential channel pyrexia n=1 Tax=Calliopsis andreniformis TaxID=337506 RepID=UPI003FCE7371
MAASNEDHVRMITALENDDVETATRIITEKFDKKFLQSTGILRVTAVHLAAWHGRLELLDLLYKNGADINTTDKIGRCALFHAAHRGNSEVVKWLLQRGSFTDTKVNVDSCSKDFRKSIRGPYSIGQQLPIPECWGRTALHQAVKNNHSEVVKLLVNANTDVNVQDERGITPLLLAGSSVIQKDSIEMSKFVDIIEILVSAKASLNVIDPNTGATALHHATILGSSLATKRLIDGGACPLYQCNNTGSTLLHFAASVGNIDTLLILLEAIPRDYIDIQDKINRTPLHRASYSGHIECVRALINFGGNLAARTKVGVTVIDAIFAHIPKPVLFLQNILDSWVGRNNNYTDRYSYITINFDILAPKGELQMGVINSLIAAASDMEHLTLLQHPLVETFLWLKWSKLRVFFLSLVFVHALLILSLSGYSIMLLQYGIDSVLLRAILTCCSCFLLFHNMVQVLMLPRYYLKRCETWLSFACAAMSLVISLNTANIAIQVKKGTLNLPQQSSQWMLRFLSVSILLGWIQMMLLIGRLPICGYYALMFSTVLKNILKVLLAFVCLIVGFALSFFVLFPENDQFRNSWRAVVKTVVMMMGEYEYGALFSDTKNGSSFLPAMDGVVFLAFVVLASIVLMNLMIGLAVNDIQGLVKEGHIRQLLKQAEFIGHIEMLTSHRIFRNNWLHWLIESRRNIPTKITFRYYGNYPKSYLSIPTMLREALFLLASKQSLRNKSLVTNVAQENNHTQLAALLEEVLLRLKTSSYHTTTSTRKISKPFNMFKLVRRRKIIHKNIKKI